MDTEALKKYWSKSLALIGFGFEEDERSMIHLFGNGVLVAYKNTIWLISCLDFFEEETNGYPFKIVFPGEEVSHTVVLHRDFIDKNAIEFTGQNMVMVPISKATSDKPWTLDIPKLFNWYPPQTPLPEHGNWLFITRPVSKIKPAAAFNPSSLEQITAHQAEFLTSKETLQSEEQRSLNNVNILRPVNSNFQLDPDCSQEESETLQYYLSGYLGGIILTNHSNGKTIPAGIINGTGITTLEDTETGTSSKSGILLFNKLSTTLMKSSSESN